MVSSLLLDGTSLIDVIQQQKMEFVDRLQMADAKADHPVAEHSTA
jgi:hypothetical protein